jgi:hypothetical protein
MGHSLPIQNKRSLKPTVVYVLVQLVIRWISISHFSRDVGQQVRRMWQREPTGRAFNLSQIKLSSADLLASRFF